MIPPMNPVGLVPLALFGGEFWFGLAIVLMCRLGVGTVLTLGFVPVLYSLMLGRERVSAASRQPGDEGWGPSRSFPRRFYPLLLRSGRSDVGQLRVVEAHAFSRSPAERELGDHRIEFAGQAVRIGEIAQSVRSLGVAQ